MPKTIKPSDAAWRDIEKSCPNTIAELKGSGTIETARNLFEIAFMKGQMHGSQETLEKAVTAMRKTGQD